MNQDDEQWTEDQDLDAFLDEYPSKNTVSDWVVTAVLILVILALLGVCFGEFHHVWG